MPAAHLRRSWRHVHTAAATKPATYAEEAKGTSPDMSFLEMLDIVN